MNNPFTLLYEEHDVILGAIRRGKALQGLWNTDPDKYISEMKRLLAFFREFADGYHHRKEEEVLFPAIKNHPDFVLEEIIDEFEQHHEDFRGYGNEIEECLDLGENERSFKVFNRYCSELEDHIGAENDEIFVLAESLMSETDREKIYFLFQDVDRENGNERKRELETQE